MEEVEIRLVKGDSSIAWVLGGGELVESKDGEDTALDEYDTPQATRQELHKRLEAALSDGYKLPEHEGDRTEKALIERVMPFMAVFGEEVLPRLQNVVLPKVTSKALFEVQPDGFVCEFPVEVFLFDADGNEQSSITLLEDVEWILPDSLIDDDAWEEAEVGTMEAYSAALIAQLHKWVTHLGAAAVPEGAQLFGHLHDDEKAMDLVKGTWGEADFF